MGLGFRESVKKIRCEPSFFLKCKIREIYYPQIYHLYGIFNQNFDKWLLARTWALHTI